MNSPCCFKKPYWRAIDQHRKPIIRQGLKNIRSTTHSRKPNCQSIKIRKFHSTQSYAFFISSFSIKFRHHNLLSRSSVISCASRMLLIMLLPDTKPDYQGEISLGSKRLSRIVKIFEIIFELKLHKLIGLNSCHFIAPRTFGIKTISALVNPLGWDAPLKNS